ncbi:HNH endonuclease [Ammoniphilus sp. 3BR4]|uniref:HNH endonuclease n=1 Tax=Ammoniphilus sp. 3BR4 TaxID=3158265 RepID=UPI00346658EA
MDLNNGLLLCPNHDALFEKGLISFRDDGGIFVSPSVDDTFKIFLNIKWAED